MLNWFDTHAGLACWIAGLALAVIAACIVAAWAEGASRRRLAESAILWAALHPIRSLRDATRELREAVERNDGRLKLAEAPSLRDGALAQRIRDVRAAPLTGLTSPRAIEAAYQAREAAAQLMVWLERQGRDPAGSRLQIQMIWKALHDAAGNLERDIVKSAK